MKTKTITPKKKLSPAQMRVAIAKDVLAQIKAKKYIPEQGGYVCETDQSFFEDGYANEKFNQEKAKVLPPCNVCAVGAAILSGLRLFNEITYCNTHEQSDAMKALSKWFPKHQVALMENSFEGDMRHDVSDEDMNLCVQFYANYYQDADRLKAIMNNIITNEGEFILPA